jgi:phosphohistidine phosphatase
MDLYLVRHGEAKSEAEDPERSLTDRGAEAVRRMAAWAAQVGVRVDQIRHSGKRRAEQTAALLAERLSPRQGMVAVPGLAPDDDVHPVAEALQGEPGAIMLVGHLPFLGRLISLLLAGNSDTGTVGFQPAEIVCLSSPREGKWSVNWVMSPDLL